ncbi:transcription factor Rap1 [Blastomyces dermatitidis ATCC 18188]|uniref:DNA-binding protein RAP1 n=1 Tax=Ajellomyces dermatitidis (strain ATCC 18188 / CBS 674.68) TaxID=653446 RepID=F2THV0_AJEDA|nr:transcription factor Rap1 [Blastomyces dermatitidis ATCC 18188]
MPGPAVVYSGVSNANMTSGLFKDTKFWLSRTVPSRSWIIQQIQANGGKVVLLEKDADVLLVDHMRGNNPPGSISFQYIEKSIQNGRLESLEDHRAGPEAMYVRPVGSTITRPKSHRSAFTAKDDQILYDWVKPFEEKGGQIGGNKIYQQLAEKYPHHTFQSWRDRYLKKVKDRSRPVAPERGSSSASSARQADRKTRTQERHPVDTSKAGAPGSSSHRYERFTKEEKEDLLNHVKDILNIEEGKEGEAWSAYAENTGKSVAEWKSFFHNVILPEYKARRSKPDPSRRTPQANRHEATATPSPSTESSRRQRSESHNHLPVPESGKPQHFTPRKKQRIDIRKRRQSAVDIPSTGIESSSAKRRKRSTIGHIPQASASPSATSIQSDKIVTSKRPPGDSRSSSAREGSTHSKFDSPYPGNSEKSGSASCAVSTTNSASEERFETAPQQFRQETLESHYQTPPQLLDREGELNGSQTPQPTPVTDGDARAGNGPSSSADDQPSIEHMDEWIASKTTGRNAYTQQQVLEALACTTMDPDLADTVLETMAAGKGIPDNVRGVWTQEDDECLEAPDSKGIEAVLQKHGDELFNARFEYIMTRREVIIQMEDPAE